MCLTGTAHSRLLMALFAGGLERSTTKCWRDWPEYRRRPAPWETETGRSAEDPDEYILHVQRLRAGEREMNIWLQMVILRRSKDKGRQIAAPCFQNGLIELLNRNRARVAH